MKDTKKAVEDPFFRKSLGLFELVSLGVGGTIGSGIFVVPAIASKISGPASLFSWVIVAVSSSCVLLSLAGISWRLSKAGSFLGLFTVVFGTRIATPIVLMYLVSSVFGIATIAAGIGQYLTYLGLRDVLSIEIAVLTLFCIVNVIGVAFSGTTENILTTLKTVPLVLIALLLLPHIDTANFVPNRSVSASSIIATVIIVYWPFTGFEISAIPVDESKDVSLIKKSLLLVMGIVTAVYLLLNIALIGSVGADALASSSAPIATATALVLPQSGPVVALIGILAMLSALNAYIIGTSRVLHNFADRFSIPLIRDLGARGTPTVSLVVSCLTCAGLLFFSNHFDVLASISVITTLIPYVFFCLCSWVLETGTWSRVIAGAGTVSTAAILALYFIL
jgi:amino acid transporter